MSAIVENEYFTNVYINNIEGSVSEAALRDICETFGGRVVSLVIIRENGVSLGYGFCNFATHEEAVRAIENMNNLFIVNKKIAVSRATTKAERAKFLRSVHCPLESPEKNPNVYVKNLDYSIEEETLRKYFRPFGTIINVRIMRDDIGNSKGFGFVSFSDYMDARKAVAAMDGVRIGKLAIHVDFYESKEGKAASAPATPSAGPAAVPLRLVLPSKKPSPLVIPSDPVVGSPKLSVPPEIGSPIIVVKKKEEEKEEETKKEEEEKRDAKEEGQKRKKKRRRRRRKEERKANASDKESSSISAVVLSSADPPIDFIDYDEEGTDTEDSGKSTDEGKSLEALKAEHQRQLAASRGIIVHGLRYSYTEKDVRRFFYDVSVADVKPMTNRRGFFNGEWLVSFRTAEDANTALRICNDLGKFNPWSQRVHAEKSLIPPSPQPQPSIHDLIYPAESNPAEPSTEENANEADEADDFDFDPIYNRLIFGENDDETGEGVAKEEGFFPSLGPSFGSSAASHKTIDFSNFSLFSSTWFSDDDFTSLL